MSRTFVIADLHGRYDLFEQAYRRACEASASLQDRFIVLGDFVDRGPESAQIIAKMRHLQTVRHPGDLELIVLCGNHESIMLSAMVYPRQHISWWVGNGGGATLKSYSIGGYGVEGEWWDWLNTAKRDYEWLTQLPDVLEDEHRIYVHAGIPWDKTVEETPSGTRQWMLYGYTASDVEWNELAGRHISGKHIVHGHHQSADHPLLLPGRTDLDSWAYHTGRLAIGVFEDDVPGGPVEILWATGPASH